jgi:hypothetical protein
MQLPVKYSNIFTSDRKGGLPLLIDSPIWSLITIAGLQDSLEGILDGDGCSSKSGPSKGWCCGVGSE